MVRENSLAVHVPLDFEHELAANHAISDLEGLHELVFRLVDEIEAKHESFLLEILIKFKLKIRNVSILVF